MATEQEFTDSEERARLYRARARNRADAVRLRALRLLPASPEPARDLRAAYEPLAGELDGGGAATLDSMRGDDLAPRG